MNSSKEKISSSCIQCENYKKEIEEKDTKIKILENNILKIKSLLSESGSLIDGYNEIMEENKNLKEEVENLKNNINILNNNNYQFDLLKQKMLRYQKENEELKASKQFYESQKKEKNNIKDANETKIKRELSQKDKEINQLNTVISLLKIHNNDQQLTNDEIIKKYSKSKINSNSIDDDEIMFMDNGNNNHELEYRKNTNYFNNNFELL
jgi:chromosome segregation ATPase